MVGDTGETCQVHCSSQTRLKPLVLCAVSAVTSGGQTVLVPFLFFVLEALSALWPPCTTWLSWPRP